MGAISSVDDGEWHPEARTAGMEESRSLDATDFEHMLNSGRILSERKTRCQDGKTRAKVVRRA